MLSIQNLKKKKKTKTCKNLPSSLELPWRVVIALAGPDLLWDMLLLNLKWGLCWFLANTGTFLPWYIFNFSLVGST